MTLSPGTRALGHFAIAVAILISFLLVVLWDFDFLHDDPYISFRYARNLVMGYGLAFNPGERVEGYSNFLWVLIIAAVVKIGLPVVLSAKLIGVLFSGVTLFLVFRFSRHLAHDHPLVSYLAPILLATNWHFAAWATGGLETALFTMLLMLSLYAYAFEVRTGRLFLSWLPLGALALTRPEGVLYFGVIAVHHLGHSVATGNLRHGMADRFRWVAGFGIIWLAFLLWRLAYYGQLLPNTYYAKVGVPGEILWARGLAYLGGFLETKTFLLALGVVGLIVLALRCRRWSGAGHGDSTRAVIVTCLLLVLGVHLVYVASVGGDWMKGYRFLVPIVPVLCLLFQEALREMARAVDDLIGQCCSRRPILRTCWTNDLTPSSSRCAAEVRAQNLLAVAPSLMTGS